MIKTAWPRCRLLLPMIVFTIVLGTVLAGCYVAPAAPYRGWCYYHPYRC
jgi:hypothetical protein